MLYYCQISWTENDIGVIKKDWSLKKQKLNLRNMESECVQQPGSTEDSFNESRHRGLPLQQEGQFLFPLFYMLHSPGTVNKPAVQYGPNQANIKLSSFGTCSNLVIAAQNWGQICNIFPMYILLTWLFFSIVPMKLPEFCLLCSCCHRGSYNMFSVNHQLVSLSQVKHKIQKGRTPLSGHWINERKKERNRTGWISDFGYYILEYQEIHSAVLVYMMQSRGNLFNLCRSPF